MNDAWSCTKCGEPITEIEEALTPGTGPRHRTCPTLQSWRSEAVRFSKQFVEAAKDRDALLVDLQNVSRDCNDQLAQRDQRIAELTEQLRLTRLGADIEMARADEAIIKMHEALSATACTAACPAFQPGHVTDRYHRCRLSAGHVTAHSWACYDDPPVSDDSSSNHTEKKP